VRVLPGGVLVVRAARAPKVADLRRAVFVVGEQQVARQPVEDQLLLRHAGPEPDGPVLDPDSLAAVRIRLEDREGALLLPGGPNVTEDLALVVVPLERGNAAAAIGNASPVVNLPMP
jgi:hypothetical protein